MIYSIYSIHKSPITFNNTACLIFVNKDWEPETITFKCFVPGNDFMGLTQSTGKIKWNKSSEILDFEDLERLVKSSKRDHPLPKLNELKSVI